MKPDAYSEPFKTKPLKNVSLHLFYSLPEVSDPLKIDPRLSSLRPTHDTGGQDDPSETGVPRP